MFCKMTSMSSRSISRRSNLTFGARLPPPRNSTRRSKQPQSAGLSLLRDAAHAHAKPPHQKALLAVAVSVHAGGGESALSAGVISGVATRRPSDRLAKVELCDFTLIRERTDGRGEIGACRASGEGRRWGFPAQRCRSGAAVVDGGRRGRSDRRRAL